MKQIFGKRGYDERRVDAVGREMRAKLLFKLGKVKSAITVLAGIPKQRGVSGNMTTWRSRLLLKKWASSMLLERRKFGYVVKFDKATKVHEVMQDVMKKVLDGDARVVNTLFPPCLSTVYPKWKVYRDILEYHETLSSS